MTNEELVFRYQAGDALALDELIEKNKSLVYFVSKRYFSKRNYYDQEDLEQQGWIGFIQAVKSFKSDQGAKFASWAVPIIQHSIFRLLTKDKGSPAETSLQDPIEEDFTLEDILQDPEAQELIDRDFMRLELRKELETAMAEVLSTQFEQIIKLCYGWDGGRCWTFEEIGTLNNISKAAVEYGHNRSLWLLKRSRWGRQECKYRTVKNASKLITRTEDAAAYLAARRKRSKASERTWERRRQKAKDAAWQQRVDHILNSLRGGEKE